MKQNWNENLTKFPGYRTDSVWTVEHSEHVHKCASDVASSQKSHTTTPEKSICHCSQSFKNHTWSCVVNLKFNSQAGCIRIVFQFCEIRLVFFIFFHILLVSTIECINRILKSRIWFLNYNTKCNRLCNKLFAAFFSSALHMHE